MNVLKEINAEPIPGYRLLEQLGRGGFGEVWKCEAPGGLFKAIKFVDGTPEDSLEVQSTAAEEEWQAIERIKAIRHPFLLSMERVERMGGALMIVTELADANLEQVLEQRHREGHTGIPRAELLVYLLEAAEVLDLMKAQFGLQHLDVKPRNLFLLSNHVKVADFGLVHSLSHSHHDEITPLSASMLTPLYASPELCQGRISPHCDQYSLALVYHELLTGILPFNGKNARQLLMQHTCGVPDLHRLSSGDAVVVGRALAKDPAERFGSCLEFIRALSARESLEPPGDFSSALRPAPLTRPDRTNGSPPRRGGQPAGAGGAELLPGYQFLQCLERGPLTEVWQVTDPSGRPRQLKFIYGFDQRRAQSQRETIARLRALTHPALVLTEVVDCGPGRLALITDRPSKTLRDRWQECRAEGHLGIPWAELFPHLAETAEALDTLYQETGLSHLALTPRQLVLDGGLVSVADFGLVPLLWLPARRSMAQINPRYAAPELFTWHVHRSADQYSLALITHELVTGVLPKAAGRSRGGLTCADLSLGPDGLTAAEAEVLARASGGRPRSTVPQAARLSSQPCSSGQRTAISGQRSAVRSELDAQRFRQ